MIESKFIDLLDFGDSIQKIDSYSNPKFELFFKFLRTLLKNKSFPIIIDLILIVISFMQLLFISSIIVSSSQEEFILSIIEYLKNIFLLFDLITDNKIYLQLFLTVSLIIVIDIILMLFILVTMKYKELYFIIYIINVINIIMFYYLIGPGIEICLLSFWCNDGIHKFLNLECFSNPIHLKYVIFSIIICLLYILVSVIYSIYFNQIGLISTNTNKKILRIHSNYEIFYLISKISIFIFYYFLKIKNNIFILKLFYELFIFIICIFMTIYVNKYVYYYNSITNYIISYGWLFSSWFSLFIFLKIVLNITHITSFIIVGWLIILLLFYKINKIRELSTITESNILEFKSIKSIELFNTNLLKILKNNKKKKNKILLYGIIKNFEEFKKNNPEINYYYQKLLNDKYLNKKFNKSEELSILSIIFILYSLQLDKNLLKEEIILYMNYFLINKFNNLTYPIYLCSKNKSFRHINSYYKYILIEDIKEYLIHKLNNSSNKDSIKNVQISSPILYYLYQDLFKIKIYDAINNQIDYLDILKNNMINDKTTQHFLKTGNIILKTLKEIIIIWRKLIKLNPFSEELFKDYMLYLNIILQDDTLSKEESKKYILLKNEKSEERFNIYHSMFLIDRSSIILVDGYLSNGKILYASPNFPLVFSYNIKELLNYTIDELLPNAIQNFHKELIDDAIKYSNINSVFKKQINSLLKNKNGQLLNIKIFLKQIPNIKYGLIYIVYLQKILDSNFVIVLDKDLRINGFTEMILEGSSYTIGIGYNLDNKLYGYHIGLIIPDILHLLEYKNDEFTIIRKDLELKGYLYPINKYYEVKYIVDIILNKIVNNSNYHQNHNDDGHLNITYEYNQLLLELNKQNIKPYNIFYKIKMHSFLDGKYKYYKIYIKDDIIKGNENIKDLKSKRDEFENKESIDINILNFESSNSKNSKQKIIKRINKKINKKKIRIKNQTKDSKNTDKNDNNEITNNEENNSIHNNEEEDKNNLNNKEKINDSIKNFISSSESIPINLDIKFNKLKLDIINKKKIFPIQIMIYLCFVFIISSIIFLIVNFKFKKETFQDVSNFLDENIFFNLTKMSVAVLYITSINIKWQFHSCNTSNFYNMTLLYEEVLSENIDYLIWLKDFTTHFSKDFRKTVFKKNLIDLNIYGTEIKEQYKFNYYNLLYLFINNGINLLKFYPYYLNITKETKSLDPLTYGINELNELTEQTYLYYISDINGFKGKEKNKIVNIIFNVFPTVFICNIVIIIGLLVLYIFYILRINNIESYLLNKLLNFNSINFDNYLKQLDEIKKKIKNDKDDDNDNININNTDSKVEEEKERNGTKSNSLQKEIKNKKKEIKKQKIKKQKKYKINKMTSYFMKKNILFLVKIIITYILFLTYYILSFFIEKHQKNNFINFDEIADSIISLYKESFDIFIILKRELELYENTLTNCKIDNKKNIYKMKLPIISQIKTPTIGNINNKITSDSSYKKETLEKYLGLVNGDACKYLSKNDNDYRYCDYFWNGILKKGIEQTMVKINVVIGTIVQELDAINKGAKSLNDIIISSDYILFELFIDFYYQRVYRVTDDIFWKFRNEKLYSIFKILKIILIIYIIISFFLFIFLSYSVYDIKVLFYSFLNFIGILPSKYLYEDEHFYKEIIRIINDYF